MGSRRGASAASLTQGFNSLFKSVDDGYVNASRVSGTSFVDYRDPTHTIAVTAGSLAAPTSDAQFGGAVAFRLTGTQVMSSSRAAARWSFAHQAAGTTLCVVVNPLNNSNYELQLNTRSGASDGATIVREITTGRPYMEAYNGSVAAVASTGGASTAGVGTYFISQLSAAAYTMRVKSTVVVSGVPGTLSTGAGNGPLTVGSATNPMLGSLRSIYWFKRVLSADELRTLYAHIQADTGIAP